MSFKKEMLVHPVTGDKEQTWGGFSWPNFFFGVFWFIYKRLYLYAVLALVAVTLTGGFAWFVFPFFANNLHRDALLKDGWKLAEGDDK